MGRQGALSSESESELAQPCPTLCNHMNCSLPGSSAHGIFQASTTVLPPKESRVGGKTAFFLILQIDIRFTSLAPPSYWAWECLTLWGQTRIITMQIQIRKRVVTFFFHLMTWDLSHAFIYGFTVSQACFTPQCSNTFLELSLTYSGLPKFPRFSSLPIDPYWDFYNYLYNYIILFLSLWGMVSISIES